MGTHYSRKNQLFQNYVKGLPWFFDFEKSSVSSYPTFSILQNPVYHNHSPSFLTTLHHFPLLSITFHYYPSLSITLHHSPSLPTTLRHSPLIPITLHYSPPLSISSHTSVPILAPLCRQPDRIVLHFQPENQTGSVFSGIQPDFLMRTT